MKNLLEEFKAFILKGNIVTLAVAFVMGVAFSSLVTSIVQGIITPLVNAIGGSSNVSLHIGIFNVGIILSAAINFLATAVAVFFVVVKPVNKLVSLTEKPKDPNAPTPPPPATLDDVVAALKDLKKQ